MQQKNFFVFVATVIMTFVASVFVSCERDNELLNMVREQSDTIKIVNGLNVITDLTHKVDTSNRNHPTDDMTSTLKILKTENGKVTDELFNHTVNPYFQATGKLTKEDYKITREQLEANPTSKKINRHVVDDGGDVKYEVDTVYFYFADGQTFYIPIDISKPVIAVGSSDYEYPTLTLTGAEFVGLKNEPLGTKAETIVEPYNTTYKAVLELTEINKENPQVIKVPVEPSTIRSIVTNNDVVKVEALNKTRQGLTTTTERCAFDKVTTYKNGETTTQTIEKILSHLFWGIEPYSKDVTSFAYTLNGRNGIKQGSEEKDNEESEGFWNVWKRTDNYSANISNGVTAEKIVTDYSLMHKRAIYKDADVEVIFGYEDITVNETANDTKVNEVTSDRSGYRKADLNNAIGTTYLTIEQPLNETVYLYMVDKGVKNYEIQNAKLTVYRDSVVAVLDWVTIFNDGTKETVKEHINKPRTLAPISDWSSIQKKAEQTTAKEVKVELTSQNKTDGYWSYVQEIRSLSNQTTLPDNTTKTNAWLCETPNNFVYERSGVKKEFDEISFAVEQVSATLTENGTEGAYKLYDFVDQIKVTFGSDKQTSNAPGLLKVSTDVEKYDYKDKKLTITDNDVTAQVTFVTVYSDGKQDEEVIKETFPRKLETLSNWTSSEYKPDVSTGSANVQVLTRDKKTQGDFTYYEEVREITTKATLNNSVQTNQWKSTDPNRIVFKKNGVTVDFGTISFSATEKGQNVAKIDDKNYNYTDKIEVVYGDNTKNATAPGKIVITNATPTGYEISNAKLTVSQDKVNTSLTFTTNFSDGTSTEENISKDFPRSFRQISNWTSEEENATQNTGSASVNLTGSNNQTDGDFSYVKETRSIKTIATLKGSSQNNEWESVDPNKIVFSRNGKSYDFGTISFSATEKGANVSLANETATLATYSYTDNLSVTYGDNTFSSTAPGTIKVAKEVVPTGYEISNAKLTVSQDKVNTSLTFTTKYSDGSKKDENISKDFPRSFSVKSNWTSNEENANQSTGSASVNLTGSNNQTDGDFSYVKETRSIKTIATLKGSSQNNEWESVDPNKIVFSRNGKSYDFGTISFSATEKGANVNLANETATLATYNYTDNISVSYGDNTFSSTAPGTIKVAKEVVPTGYEISNAKLTVSQDKVNTSLTFTTNYSDGSKKDENISKDFPRSFSVKSNWTSNEEDNSQSTGSASVNLKSSSSKTDGDFSYSQETRQITTKATLKGSTQTNEWESVDPNKIVFSRNGKSYDFGTISFSATEKGASTSLVNETATSATYNYTDNLSVTYGDNTFSSTAPGKINVAKPKTVTSRETSNEKLTITPDKVNASLTFITNYSDGSKDEENISKDFPRSLTAKSNWKAEEENANQTTGSASVSLTGSNNQTDGYFSYVKETRSIKTVATLNSSAKKTNEWESVEPNKIVFSRDGVSYNFGEVSFTAEETGANVTKKSNDVYGYTDNIKVVFGDNTKTSTAPGTINIWKSDFPAEYGKFVKATVTTTRDESRKTWMYIVSVQFEKKTLPIFIHKNDSKPSYDLKYAVAANSKYNSASYIKSQDSWINTIASDGAECLDWTTIDGKNEDNIPYSTAVAWGWDYGYQKNGHPTVFTKTFTATVSNSVLTIKKGDTVFATYKSVK